MSTVSKKHSHKITKSLLQKMDAYWRASNYLSVGQIYLLDNPLLREPLQKAHIKPNLLGHWGTTPGQNFIYVHLNRAINAYDLNMLYISGPGHGGPAIVGNVYLEGTYSEFYPEITQDDAGLKSSSSSFRFQEAFPVMYRRNVPVLFMRVANWVIRLAMHLEQCSTIPI